MTEASDLDSSAKSASPPRRPSIVHRVGVGCHHEVLGRRFVRRMTMMSLVVCALRKRREADAPAVAPVDGTTRVWDAAAAAG